MSSSSAQPEVSRTFSTLSLTERKIMVTVDGSQHSDYALEWVFDNVYRPTDKLLLVHASAPPAIPEVGFGAVPEHLYSEMIERNRQQTRHLLKRYEKMTKRIMHDRLHGKISIIHEQGHPKEVIVRIANQEKADIVVVASRGLGAIQYAVLGSTSQFLVNHLKMPVIVVHKPPALASVPASRGQA
ncbi:Universal stress protein A-like protein [Porphyridium purpureum]|uniref:Universal stress protein A-like protein n=1 Tax=Porphyridium purpureum TaxID=35688 RepID=A0A5J4YR90_PORPP|nr:Universal stress protein A-like protein [Porphyridium purpureum]|eukprot:POR1977..scf229_5